MRYVEFVKAGGTGQDRRPSAAVPVRYYDNKSSSGHDDRVRTKGLYDVYTYMLIGFAET